MKQRSEQNKIKNSIKNNREIEKKQKSRLYNTKNTTYGIEDIKDMFA